MATEEGIFVGISSGAGASSDADREELGKGNASGCAPDTGERYLSTPLFEYTDLVNAPMTTPAMYAAQQAAAAPAP